MKVITCGVYNKTQVSNCKYDLVVKGHSQIYLKLVYSS